MEVKKKLKFEKNTGIFHIYICTKGCKGLCHISKVPVHDDKKSSIGCKSSWPFTAMATGENGLIKALIQGDIYVVPPKGQVNSE